MGHGNRGNNLLGGVVSVDGCLVGRCHTSAASVSASVAAVSALEMIAVVMVVMVATRGSCRARVVWAGDFNMSRGLRGSVDCVCLAAIRMGGCCVDVTLEK